MSDDVSDTDAFRVLSASQAPTTSHVTGCRRAAGRPAGSLDQVSRWVIRLPAGRNVVAPSRLWGAGVWHSRSPGLLLKMVRLQA